MFPFERWRVYRLALELRAVAAELSKTRLRGFASDLSHLRESASSVVFNLGEGALRQKKNSKLEFYRIALGSVGECFAILTVLFPVHPNRKLIEHGQALCNHIAALITNLIASVEAKYD